MTTTRISPSAITNFVACHHLTALDRAAARGELQRPSYRDAAADVLAKLGLQHEASFLAKLKAEVHGEVVELGPEQSWPEAAELTIAAMKRGAAVIYQATFLAPPYLGRADFVVRVATPSKLGEWSYEAIDTKLARSTKPSAVLQLCFYSEQIEHIQGTPPQHMHVELGGSRGRESFEVALFSAYFRKVRGDLERQGDRLTLASTYPEPVDRCQTCDWSSRCEARRRQDDHLSLVAGIHRTHRELLVEHEVETLAKLAKLSPERQLDGINPASLSRIRQQARIQADGRQQGRLLHELLDLPAEEIGLSLLPAPSPGDVFFDIEADPYAAVDGLEYLLGFVTRAEGEAQYHPIWALSRSAEKVAFENFVDEIERRRAVHPALHVYHYAAYETGALKRLAGRHNTRFEIIDQWLRAGLFVDLYQVVRRSLRASVESYSIKKVEALYGFERTVSLRDANASLGAFETWLALGGEQASDRSILETIAGYNRDDCDSTLVLRDWLETLRAEFQAKRAVTLPRPTPSSGEASQETAARSERVEALFAALTATLPADTEAFDPVHRAQWLAAQLLEFHRREDKALWWEFFRLCTLTDEELIEEKNPIGGLHYVGEVGREKRSIIHRYSFPAQSHSLEPGLGAIDPRTQKPAGTIVAVDEERRTIDLKRVATSAVPHPSALFPFELVTTTVLSNALASLAEAIIAHGVDGSGRFRAARDLLLRRAPRLRDGDSLTRGPGETSVARARRLALALQDGVLPVQGPPGAGKTYTGAQMILALVRAGKRVGITANSHKVIGHLISGLCAALGPEDSALRIGQKTARGDEVAHPQVMTLGAESNAAIAEMLGDGRVQVVGGTAWLWADESLRSAVDVLVVDEAGQMSLANTLAVASSASSLILLGDPQQLNQPLKGIHPEGVGVSALGHLLGGAARSATLSPEQGIFLSETWRMHDDVCAFISEAFYDGRLTAHESTRRQRLLVKTGIKATGLAQHAVAHIHNQAESSEEVRAVLGLVSSLTAPGMRWIDAKRGEQPLTLADVLVVAPYNAQVAALEEALPKGARVGTVDKFQGQEAAVVIFSMTTSSPDDAPRGMEFLYSPNRLNVAISRAKCLAIVVASPALFDVDCKTPRQMQLVNAFCRYLELSC